MPDSSTILSLPYILPAQAQKHVTHNEAIRLLDIVVQLVVLDRTRQLPPALPEAGQRHIVASGASGVWTGQAGKIAFYENDTWQFLTPLVGWQAWVDAEAVMAVCNGSGWASPSEGPLNVQRLGISSAVASETNRLAVASPATLLDHAGAGHQVKINKATTTDSASLVFQTGYAARAELGTLGGDDFTLKVSPDGTGFLDALTIAAATGIASLPQGITAAGFSLLDPLDTTKRAMFTLAGLPTGTTRSYALPNASTELAGLAGTQTFSGTKTFSSTLTASGAVATLGSSTGTSTYGVGSGATAAGNTKTVNLGTGGANGSTTVVNIGSAVSGAGGSMVINSPSVTFASGVTSISASQAAIAANVLGLGGAGGDATNRLSVNAPATLLNHAGAGHQLKLNKAGASDTASLTFQTGFSGRAEMGTTGSDDFAIKVSPDGASFVTALTVARASGEVSVAQPLTLGGQTGDPASPANGMVWLHSPTGQIRLRSGGATLAIGAVGDGSRGDVTVAGGGQTWALHPSVKYGVQIALNQQMFFN